MENKQDPNQPLLSQLCQVLNHPDLPALLHRLTNPETSQETKEQTQENQDHPSLLLRMEGLHSSRHLKNQLNPLETEKSRKWPRSTLFYESSGRTLMSRLLNPKRKQHSTHTSPKSWQSNHPLTKQVEPGNQKKHRQNQPTLESQEAISMELDEPEKMESLNQKMTMNHRQKDLVSMNPKCHGFPPQTNQPLHLETPVVRKPVGYCEPTTEISQKLSSSLKLLQTHWLDSPLHGGNESSKVSQLISTKSSCHSTMLSLMKREQVAWETQKSLSESLKQRKEFQLLQNSLPLGGKHQSQLPLLFHIGERNSLTTEIPLKLNLLPNTLPSTIKSSSMMLPSETKLQQHNKSSLQTRLGSLDFILPSSCLMESNHLQTS